MANPFLNPKIQSLRLAAEHGTNPCLSSPPLFPFLPSKAVLSFPAVQHKMLDCPSRPSGGNPYSEPTLNGVTAGRRRSSSAQRCHNKLPDVVAEVMARHQAELAKLHGELGRSSSNREEAIRERKGCGLFIKHVVERSQSQMNRPSARVLDKTEGQQRMGRSRRSYDHRSSEQLDAQQQQQQPPQLTLVLMGGPKTGKSALVNQFLWEAFLAEYRPTVEEFNWVEYGRADQPESNFLLQLIDSSGSRDFLAMRHLYYRIGDAFMVVYAANDAQSYAEALAMLREISQQNCKDAPILLVQNKSDLAPARDLPMENGGSFDNAAGEDQEMQQLLAGVRRMRVTAKNLEQVKGAFWWLIEELVRRSNFANLTLIGENRPTIAEGGKKRRGSSALVAASKAALTRRRQSMPSRRTASELGIDEESLKRLMKRHDTQSRHGCAIQ